MKKTWNVPSIETLDVRMTESGAKPSEVGEDATNNSTEPSEYEGGSFIIVENQWQFIHETHPVS